MGLKPRSSRLSPLGYWLWNKNIKDFDFAASMKAHLGAPKFSSSTVENWRYGRAVPKDRELAAVIALTGLTAGQILGVE